MSSALESLPRFLTFPLTVSPFAPVFFTSIFPLLLSTVPSTVIPPAPVLSINISPVLLTVPVLEILIALPLFRIDNLCPVVLMLPFTSMFPASFLITA